jgi:hypothetical protein
LQAKLARPVLTAAFALGQELVDIYLNNDFLTGVTAELDAKFSYLDTKK